MPLVSFTHNHHFDITRHLCFDGKTLFIKEIIFQKSKKIIADVRR